MILTNQSTVSGWIWTKERSPLWWDDQTEIWSAEFYVFTPLVGPVRLPILVDIENEGSSIAFIHRDPLTPVRTHHRSGHQGETAEILPGSDYGKRLTHQDINCLEMVLNLRVEQNAFRLNLMQTLPRYHWQPGETGSPHDVPLGFPS